MSIYKMSLHQLVREKVYTLARLREIKRLIKIKKRDEEGKK